MTDRVRIGQGQARKDRGLLKHDYAEPCVVCGGVVFEWWGSETCRDCEQSEDGRDSEQTTLMTDGGVVTDSPKFETLTLGDADPTIADLNDIYLDGTLVLIGCGAAKRDPEDPTDLQVASVGPNEELRQNGPMGPAWKARDLYTSSYFSVKRQLAETVSQWCGRDDGWAVLSAEHGVLFPWEDVKYYDTHIDDLGGDETNPDHRVANPHGLRRPDGREIVTERDKWAATVATTMMRWIASHRDNGDLPGEGDANTLLVLAGQDYLDPLRERGVFKYGISRMSGNPNRGFKQPLQTRYLFENIDAGGFQEQMSWLSDAVSRLEEKGAATVQAEAGEWTGETRECEHCGVAGPGSKLTDIDGEVICPDCRPRRCNRCDEWTHESGLGQYPLCPDCQTEYGGQKRDEFDPDTTEQLDMAETLAATDDGPVRDQSGDSS